MARLRNNLRRYHYSVYFPDNVADMLLEFFDQIDEINITYHAAYQMFDDPRGVIDMPTKKDLLKKSNTLVEFYENLDQYGQPTGKIQKILIRVKHFNDRMDYTYLLARESYIVSAWANFKSDIHRLTARSLVDYYRPAGRQKLAA